MVLTQPASRTAPTQIAPKDKNFLFIGHMQSNAARASISKHHSFCQVSSFYPLFKVDMDTMIIALPPSQEIAMARQRPGFQPKSILQSYALRYRMIPTTTEYN